MFQHLCCVLCLLSDALSWLVLRGADQFMACYFQLCSQQVGVSYCPKKWAQAAAIAYVAGDVSAGAEADQQGGLRQFERLTKVSVEGLRYRAEDIARSLTKSSIKEACPFDPFILFEHLSPCFMPLKVLP